MIFINISTDRWNHIIEMMLQDHWEVTYKYDAFDAGIDFDLIELKKGDEKVLFGWDNWVEGEIKCSEERRRYIEKLAGVSLQEGEALNLKPTVIGLYLTPE